MDVAACYTQGDCVGLRPCMADVEVIVSPRAFVRLIGVLLLLGGPVGGFWLGMSLPEETTGPFPAILFYGGVILGVLTLIGSSIRTDKD